MVATTHGRRLVRNNVYLFCNIVNNMAVQTAEQYAKAQSAASELGYESVGDLKSFLSELPVDSITASAPIFPDPVADNNLSYEGIVSGAQSYLDDVTKKEAELSQGMSAADQRLNQLMGATEGRGQAILTAEDDAGLDRQQSYINDLNKTILNKTNALRKARIADEYSVQMLEGRGGIPLEIVRGQQARLEKQQLMRRNVDAANLSNLISTSELLQGNVNSARESIERRINLKYDDAQQAVDNEMFFYEKNWERLSAAQKEKATARMELLNAQKDAIEDAKDDERAVFDLQAAAAEAGADAATIQAIGNAGSKEEAANLAYKYIGGQQAIDRDLDRQRVRQQLANAVDEASGDFSFNGAERQALLTEIPQAKIDQLEKDIREYAMIGAVERGNYSPTEQEVIAEVFGVSDAPTDEDVAAGRAAVSRYTPTLTYEEAKKFSNNTDYDTWYDLDSGAGAYINAQDAVRAQDTAMYDALIASGMTPQEAVQEVIKQANK